MKKVILTTIAGAILATGAIADSGLNKTKDFLLGHAVALHNKAKDMKHDTNEYAEIIKSCNYDYDKCWRENRSAIAHELDELKEAWIEASNNYEIMEGLVAGIPTLVKYDLILDAGIPASEGNEDVAPYDLKMVDGTILKKPGNHFHNLLEPAIWGTIDKYVAKKVDLNNDGSIIIGEVLPKVDFLLSVTSSFEYWTNQLLQDAKKWKPSIKDVFTAELTMIPTMGDYFEDWKNSTLLEKGTAFVAESRLYDIKGISGGLKVAYLSSLSSKIAKVDPQLDKQIKLGFFDLTTFVDDLYMEELSGKKFKPEEADAFAGQAQDMADRLSALVARGAKKLNITPEI